VSLVTGDFNADGYTDLAIGVLSTVDGQPEAGAVAVLYGSSAGLTSSGNQLWSQDSPGIRNWSESHDDFGWSLAAGDFNGDGFTDLAVGVRREQIGPAVNAGAVNVIYGSSKGLTATGNQFWSQDSRVSSTRRRATTSSAVPSPREISTATGTRTWRSAFRTRTTTTFATAESTSSTAPPRD